MSAPVASSTRLDPAVVRRRRNTELGLLILSVVVIALAYVLVGLSQDPQLPEGLIAYVGALSGLAAVIHVATRRLAPGADPTLVPVAFLLNGLGVVMVRRLDFALEDRLENSLAPAQTLWTLIAVTGFVIVLVVIRDHRVLDRYRYVLALASLIALVLPLAPIIGRTVNGATLWIRVGAFTIQPAEFAKLGLTVFFASYLAENRQILSVATNRFGPFMVPPARAFMPVFVAWGASLAILVAQNDLGLSLLLFGSFVAVLYIATGRPAYPLGGLGMFGVAGLIGYLLVGRVDLADRLFGRVAQRISIWLDPWADFQGSGYQLAQSLFAFGTGGTFGVGWGNGRPDLIPFVQTDFIFSAFGEELGLVGATAILLCFFVLVGRGFRIALRCRDDFGMLLAAGLTTLFAIQCFVILGGVTRLIPLTGLTLPFMSYGGSSLLANWALVALLLRISANEAPARSGSA